MPKGKCRGRGKGKGKAKKIIEEGGQEEEMMVPVREEANTDDESDIEGGGARGKTFGNSLPEQEQEALAEFYTDNALFYDKQLSDYKH